ncbi:MAG: HlyD family efflux transporter periplasmic adaptor subunit [Isosphaeraceae bacterium]
MIAGIGLILVLWHGLTPRGAADFPVASARSTVVRHCAIEYEYSTSIGSPVMSVLQESLVTAGDRVKAGQVLGRLQDGEAQAEVRLREAEASSDVGVRLSEARNAQALTKAQRTENLVRRNAASQEESTLHRLEAAAAALELEQAKYRRTIAAIQLDQAKALLRTRMLISPHDGTVEAVLRRKGEPVAPRDPVFQVVNTDTLRVVAQVDLSDVWKLKVGQAVSVIPEIAGVDLPVEHEVFAGQIAFIDNQIDPTTRTCKVHVRTENRDHLLRAGLEARIEIDSRSSPRTADGRTTPPR